METKWWILIALQHFLIWILLVRIKQLKKTIATIDHFLRELHLTCKKMNTWDEAEKAVEKLCNTLGIKTKYQ